MDQNTQPQQPNENNTAAPQPVQAQQTMPQQQAAASKKGGHVGPLAGTIIIIALLALGALYFYGARLNKQQDQLPYIPGDETAAMQDTSADPAAAAAAIDAAIDASGAANLDAEIDASMKELEGQL